MDRSRTPGGEVSVTILEHLLGVFLDQCFKRKKMVINSMGVDRSIAMSSSGDYDRGFGGCSRLTCEGVGHRSLMYSQEADDRFISVPIHINRNMVMEDYGQDMCAYYLGTEMERPSLSVRATKKDAVTWIFWSSRHSINRHPTNLPRPKNVSDAY